MTAASLSSSLPDGVPTRGRLGPWKLVVFVWALVVLGSGMQNWATYQLKGEHDTVWACIVWAFNDWVGWLLLAPLIFFLARRFPLERPGLSGRILFHSIAAVLLSTAHGFIYFLMEWWTGQLWHEMTPAQLLPVYLTRSFVLGLLIYAALVGIRQGVTWYRRYKERELRETALTAKLSRARLEVLKMQLQPHFLFNTLHAISALIPKEPEAADRIITRLGDLLRLSLQSNGTQEVPLKQELEFVEKYIEIQETRFRDRLEIRIGAEPDALPGMVPSLILQPLIENSIRHGAEARETVSHIEVTARRVGDRLRLEVSDDGPGFPEEIRTPVPGRGLGLANTRARIEALYEGAGRIDVGVSKSGGALVVIDLPFRTDAGASA